MWLHTVTNPCNVASCEHEYELLHFLGVVFLSSLFVGVELKELNAMPTEPNVYYLLREMSLILNVYSEVCMANALFDWTH